MEEKTELTNTFILKIQRPVMSECSTPRLLIYSEDGKTVPIQMVPDNGSYHEALGTRCKAYFLCTMKDDQLRILGEVKRRDTM